MANYHILNGKSDGNQLRVVFHLSMPDTNNAVGVGYQAALLMHLGGVQDSVVPASLLGANEQNDLTSGALYEHVWQFSTQPEMTLLEKQDIMDARYTAFASGVIAALQARLEFYGYSRDVP